MSDAQKKLDLFVSTAKAFNQEYPELILRVMIKAIDDMTFDELESAIEKSLQTSIWMPTIASLWEIVNQKREEEKVKIVQKVTTWLIKHCDWDYSQQAMQKHVDKALISMGLEAGSIKTSDI